MFDWTMETECKLPFDPGPLLDKILDAVLTEEKIPYEAYVSMILTDEEEIQALNREARGIDRVTDVLSFPALECKEGELPSDLEEGDPCYFLPDSGELCLGDIALCVPKVFLQAEEYGHSPLREFAFLTVHSLLHLLGYDHMEEEERLRMEAKQEKILQTLGIGRDVDEE